MKSNLLGGIVLGSIFLLSCEKNIDIPLENTSPQVIVEGTIQQNEKPKILITRSSDYFATLPTTPAEIAKYIVQNAVVTVSNGTVTESLHPVLDTKYPFFYYTSDNLVGEIGKTYELNIQADGKTLTSSTTIPNPVMLDSIWFKRSDVANNDSIGYVWVRHPDPPELNNCYRIYVQVNSEDRYYAIPNPFDDKFMNGTTYDAFIIHPDPTGEYDRAKNRKIGYFQRGDTVRINLASIGTRELQFYRVYENNRSGRGNPFSAPIVLPTNIVGGNGIWAGHGAGLHTFIIP